MLFKCDDTLLFLYYILQIVFVKYCYTLYQYFGPSMAWYTERFLNMSSRKPCVQCMTSKQLYTEEHRRFLKWKPYSCLVPCCYQLPSHLPKTHQRTCSPVLSDVSVHDSPAANPSVGWMSVSSSFIIPLIRHPHHCFYISSSHTDNWWPSLPPSSHFSHVFSSFLPPPQVDPVLFFFLLSSQCSTLLYVLHLALDMFVSISVMFPEIPCT